MYRALLSTAAAFLLGGSAVEAANDRPIIAVFSQPFEEMPGYDYIGLCIPLFLSSPFARMRLPLHCPSPLLHTSSRQLCEVGRTVRWSCRAGPLFCVQQSHRNDFFIHQRGPLSWRVKLMFPLFLL